MTPEEHQEYRELIHRFGCSDITEEQSMRLEELEAKAVAEASE
jgi:hypothetical protein